MRIEPPRRAAPTRRGYDPRVLVSTNIAHGLLAFFWAQAARRVLQPRCPALAVSLVTLVLWVPPAVSLLQALQPAPWRLLRLEGWAAALASMGPVSWALVALAVGTGLVFVAQELVPLLMRDRAWQRAPRDAHPRLDAARAAVVPGFQALGVDRPPPVRCAHTRAPVAALVGLRAPEIVVSAGLLDALDDRQLEALLAHELAHAARGGNARLTLLWILRALQALNPAALIAFRQVVEAEEAACDALAARATGRPADLASVLLAVERLDGADRLAADASGQANARHSLLRRRVRLLLDGVAGADLGRGGHLAAAGLLALLLWGVA